MTEFQKYVPINCSFFDRLQDWATRKEIVKIIFLDKDLNSNTINTRILDLFTKNSEEFIVLESGEKFRLDKLISVNGLLVTSCEIDNSKSRYDS
ncbi:hypothetical protein [Cyclobacterium qasimii]|uniref:Uncharacterized protein n=2 Tax=Cyclobacterium qasimii TaxID=1350429 RepID=S7VPR9_9BACT|nr:hypothetical protein [Cyclobacterium qasimii]EPR71337.1 hypothetical protein ADICYQ_0415 [Cyclobacterium qasimii M12-11B]GEO20517.1 hypothetical protein CQA01_10510 [Cyclobacterium qasimii]